MGKYNLHLLGWKAFENLCCSVMQQTFGVTYTPFSEGKDGGRDGFFEGEGRYDIKDKSLNGKFVFQCKHTTNSEESMKLSLVEDEIKKITLLVDELGIKHYIIFTNRKLSGGNDSIIRKKFLEINGLESCTILGSEWFDITIDGDKRLRRLVPRLYGIGDLSEIIDERVYKQSTEIIEYLKETVTTFVSTKAFQDAMAAIFEKRFVILLGPPASGKSAIATNICMSAIAENESNETLILEDANQFKEHWNPDNPKKVYWFDDVFGITNLDNYRLNAWLSSFMKLNVAIKKGATVIFTSRDYIFKEARDKIKESSFKLLFDSQVIINVGELTLPEKQQILYNHIKSGDLTKIERQTLKPYLNLLSRNKDFTPEIARRLGNKTFHNNLVVNQPSLEEFFSNPVLFFTEVIKTLDDNKKATLILILLHGNQLPSPVLEDHIPNYFKKYFDVTLPIIKNSLEIMRNSLVKHSIISQDRSWALYHPSMIDSLQTILSGNSEMIELFIFTSRINTLLRDVSCNNTQNKIFIQKSLWGILVNRFSETTTKADVKNSIVGFLLRETPDEFLIWLRFEKIEFLQSLILPSYSQLNNIPNYEFACRLEKLGLLDDCWKLMLANKIKEISIRNCDLTFLKHNDYAATILGDSGKEELINSFAELGAEHFNDEFDTLMDDIEKEDDTDEYFSEWFDSLKILMDELASLNLLSSSLEDEYNDLMDDVSHEINDYNLALNDNEEDQYDDYDDYYEYSSRTTTRTYVDIFDDVDD
ncbi:hypothetical protein [Neobacillus cucumis]|uniref:nSTAND3 domain-containing NTPase n=1 Tax=Neobacillus cucumis TaxID=1740721 RepID=UPI002E1FCF7A|nr:hypothetical protein [Neobacillus cucumis]